MTSLKILIVENFDVKQKQEIVVKFCIELIEVRIAGVSLSSAAGYLLYQASFLTMASNSRIIQSGS